MSEKNHYDCSVPYAARKTRVKSFGCGGIQWWECVGLNCSYGPIWDFLDSYPQKAQFLGLVRLTFTGVYSRIDNHGIQ